MYPAIYHNNYNYTYNNLKSDSEFIVFSIGLKMFLTSLVHGEYS